MTSPVLLDDFEAVGIREVRPEDPDPSTRYLWNQYEGVSDPGSERLAPTAAYRGSQGLEITVESGNVYLQFYPYPSPGYEWHYMRSFTQPPAAWQLDTYNRLRFWVKVPAGVNKAGGGRSNTHVGTYIRCSTCNPASAESDNGHYYHHFDLPYTGEWHQILVDTHPDHQRGASGGEELGDLPYPTGEIGFNYFDLLTRFYVRLEGSFSSYPVSFYFDNFEVYRETRPENTEQLYSLNGVYVPTSNTLIVGWQRHKDENAVPHEVRYAFEDIHQLGWDKAVPAPDGVVIPLGWQGYNAMEWTTQDIDVSGVSQIYIAIKPQNSDLFRQITIPTAPLDSNFDRDGDTLTDLDELFVYATDPLRADTDCDEINDGDEVDQGSNPLDPTSPLLPNAGVVVESVAPNTMQTSNTSIDITITGCYFEAGANVTFENGTGPTPKISNVVVYDAGKKITATVSIKNGGPHRDRIWDLSVTNPRGFSGVLIDGFTITP